MFDRLRYGAGRWVLLAVLVGLLGLGGFFGYSKVMDASTSPEPTASASVEPSAEPSAEGSTTNPSTSPSASTGADAKVDTGLPYVKFPLAKGAEQARGVRGEATDDEAFVYILVKDPAATLESVSEFYRSALEKEKWLVTPGFEAPELMKVMNDTWYGTITVRFIEDEKLYLVSGILKPLF